jgi:hypothetical protein
MQSQQSRPNYCKPFENVAMISGHLRMIFDNAHDVSPQKSLSGTINVDPLVGECVSVRLVNVDYQIPFAASGYCSDSGSHGISDVPSDPYATPGLVTEGPSNTANLMGQLPTQSIQPPSPKSSLFLI